jgi:hypothetical protein
MAGGTPDPDKLKELARRLQKAADKLDEVTKECQSAMNAADWTDAEGVRFGESLAATLRTVSAPKEPIKELAKTAQNKGAAIAQYRR